MPTTTQQVNTLLHYLQTKQQPPFPVLFWSALQKIDFDNSTASLQKISQLFAQIGKRGIDIAKILSQQGGDNFLLVIASYLGNMLAVNTGEQARWYDYHEVSQEITEQNRLNQTQFELPKVFTSSLVANIGGVYCQPLNILQTLLQGEQVLADFMGDIEHAIFAKAQVNLLDEPNEVASRYLAKLKTGKLLDNTIGFYPYLADINFDFSEQSLVAIDIALAKITQDYQFSQADYARIISEPNNQAFFYLLGFYIGATSSRLANVASKWSDYDEMAAMLGGDFINCIEQRFVQLMENHYRTPILVVTNRLFGIAPSFPNTAVEFANIIDEQNRGELHVFAKNSQESVSTKSLPTHWQHALQRAGKLLAKQLQLLITNQAVKPLLLQVDSQGEQVLSLSSMDNDTALDRLYRQLNEQGVGMQYQVASFALYVNLPHGQFEGIALEIRASEPSLAIQLILPYRVIHADNGNESASSKQWLIYPLISNQPLDEPLRHMMPQLVSVIYQAAQTPTLATLWQDYTLDTLDPFALLSISQRQSHTSLVEQITLPVFDVISTSPSSYVGLNLVLPSFDYDSISWRGYDLPKYILDTPDAQREYLQVVVPTGLIGDALFSQVESLQRFYRYGKVVWGVIVQADEALYQYDESVADTLSPEMVLTAEIVYDPTGQASINMLQQAARRLQQLSELSQETLPADQLMYLTHRQDSHSRVFALDYPASLNTTQNSELSHPLKISSLWLWRRHLPNGMLSNAVVPVMIEPDSSKQPITAKGRVMILPARFWSQPLYQHWLANTQAPNLANGGDLMPKISWQEQQGLRYMGKGLDARLFPKFKFDANKFKQSPAQPLPIASLTQRPPVAKPTMANPVGSNTPQAVTSPTLSSVKSSSADIADPASSQWASSQPASSPSVSNTVPSSMANEHLPVAQSSAAQSPVTAPKPESKTVLTPELQQQLLRDQARLQAELSTSDESKQRKLYMIIGIVVLLVVISLILASVMGK